MGDRGNGRIQIFDPDGKFIAEWKQFGRPSDIAIDKNDMIYVADSQSNPTNNPGVKQGIRIGSAKDGKVTAFIPEALRRSSGAGRRRRRRCRQRLWRLDRQDGGAAFREGLSRLPDCGPRGHAEFRGLASKFGASTSVVVPPIDRRHRISMRSDPGREPAPSPGAGQNFSSSG